MGQAYLYLLALVVIGFVAAYKFASLATKKGYQGSKAKRYPMLLMLVAIAAAVLIFLGVILIGLAMPHLQGAAHNVYYVGNWFIIAVNLLILNLAYKNMKAAPNAGGE